MGKYSRGFKFTGKGNHSSKIKIVLSCVELDESFTMSVLKERLEEKGYEVYSTQAMGNFINQNMEWKYFVKHKKEKGRLKQQYWRRIA